MTDSASIADLRRRVHALRWFHRIDLGHGIVTPGNDDSPTKLEFVHLPKDLTGKTVLDVGAWDGFFSFEAARRGALRVVAADSFSWDGGGWGSKACFDLARETLGLPVEDRRVEILDITPERMGMFDVVLFLGVLYHMKHPLLALERVASVTRELLILETHLDLVQMKNPAAIFYPGAELAHDATNWWGPNPAAVAAMLKTVGFSRVEMVDKEFHRMGLSRGLSALAGFFRQGARPVDKLGYGRGSFHAWK